MNAFKIEDKMTEVITEISTIDEQHFILKREET